MDMRNAYQTFIGCTEFTDEAPFTRRDMLNSKNSYVGSHENPNSVKEHHFYHEFSINWLGLELLEVLSILRAARIPAQLHEQAYLSAATVSRSFGISPIVDSPKNMVPL